MIKVLDARFHIGAQVGATVKSGISQKDGAVMHMGKVDDCEGLVIDGKFGERNLPNPIFIPLSMCSSLTLDRESFNMQKALVAGPFPTAKKPGRPAKEEAYERT